MLVFYHSQRTGSSGRSPVEERVEESFLGFGEGKSGGGFSGEDAGREAAHFSVQAKNLITSAGSELYF